MAKTVALWLVVLALLASVLATPLPKLKDLHATSLDLYAVDNNDYGRFAVRVERLDQVVDVKDDETASKDEGKLMAARVSDVIVMFDVSPKGEVSVNGVPVAMGMSNLQIEADVVTGVTADGEKLSADELAKAFDVGIVGMKVNVEGETISNGEVEVTKLIISEQVTEINGQEVAQNNVMQQVVEIHPDGTIVRQKPCAASGEAVQAFQAHGKHHKSRASCLRYKIARWFEELPVVVKLALSVLLGVVLGFIAMVFTRVISLIFRGPSSYEFVEVSDEHAPFIAQVSFEEKLPIYTADGYTAVDTKETEEKH